MTETFSSGATRITRHYLARRPASITGTAEVNWFFDYSLSGQAIIDALYPKNVTTTRLGTSNSLRWTQSLTDHRPKPVQERRPAFQSTNDLVKTVNFFISGLPGSLTESGIENEYGTPGERLYTLIEYNWEGEKTAEGMDYDFNQTLETNTTDRVTAFETYYETNVAGHWFKVSRELGYLTDHSGTPTQLRATKQRLTGFTATEVSELLSFDANTNQTSVKVTVDLPAAKLTTVAAVPESTLKATSVTFNGLLQTESTPSVSAVAWHYYDALGRQTSMKDSLGFTTATGYDPNTGQI